MTGRRSPPGRPWRWPQAAWLLFAAWGLAQAPLPMEASGTMETVELAPGSSQTLKFPAAIGTAFVANPQTADVEVLNNQDAVPAGPRRGHHHPQRVQHGRRTDGGLSRSRQRACRAGEHRRVPDCWRRCADQRGTRWQLVVRQRHGKEPLRGRAGAARHSGGFRRNPRGRCHRA